MGRPPTPSPAWQAQVRQVLVGELQRGALREVLLLQCGFRVEDVRVSSDLRKAFIEYTTLPRARGAAAVHLQRHAGRLRSQIFSALAVPFSPMLEFKERGTNLPQEQLDAAFDRIHSETADSSKT
eukprot:SM000038S14360  [mRNA]  locus=s38:412785:413562:- [translate_table: standard]